MNRKLFRPKPGQTHARFAAFRYNGTVGFRGDTAYLDTTAPTSQGSSGVVDGLTMSATQDFIYVVSATSVATNATIGHFTCAGIVEGPAVGSRDTVTALTDDGIVIVQVAGVHTQAWLTTEASVAAGWLALGNSAVTTGSALPQLALGTATTNQPVVDGAFVVGVIMAAAVTAQTRGTVTTAKSAPVWVRCGDVV